MVGNANTRGCAPLLPRVFFPDEESPLFTLKPNQTKRTRPPPLPGVGGGRLQGERASLVGLLAVNGVDMPSSIMPKFRGSLRNSLRLRPRGLRAKSRRRRLSHQEEDNRLRRETCATDEMKDDVIVLDIPTASANVDNSRGRKRDSPVEMEFEVVDCETNDKQTVPIAVCCIPEEAAGNKDDDDPAYLEFLLFLREPPALVEKERGSIVSSSESSEGTKTTPAPRLIESYSQLGAMGTNASNLEERSACDIVKKSRGDKRIPVSDSSNDSTTSVSKTSSSRTEAVLPVRKVVGDVNETAQMLSDVNVGRFSMTPPVETAATFTAGADATSKTSCHGMKKVDTCSAAERPHEHDKENALKLDPPDHFPVTSLVMIVPTHRRHGGKRCQVVRHTRKFVVVRDDTKDEFRIMPKFLARVEEENRAEADAGTKLAAPTSPSHFPIGRGIAVDRKHARHGGKRGVVMRHTREFVVVRFKAGNETRIKPKFLTILDKC